MVEDATVFQRGVDRIADSAPLGQDENLPGTPSVFVDLVVHEGGDCLRLVGHIGILHDPHLAWPVRRNGRQLKRFPIHIVPNKSISNGNNTRWTAVNIAKSYAEKMPNLRVVDASARRKQPFALNTGVRASFGKSIALCDADDEVAPGWLAGMGEALRQHEFVACSLDYVKLNPPWLQSGKQKTELSRIWYPPYLPVGSGSSEFCIQAQLKGIPLVFIDTAVLHYRKRNSMKSTFCQARNYAEDSANLAKRYFAPGDSASLYYRGFFREWLRLLRDMQWSRPHRQSIEWCRRLGWQVGRLKGMVNMAAYPFD